MLGTCFSSKPSLSQMLKYFRYRFSFLCAFITANTAGSRLKPTGMMQIIAILYHHHMDSINFWTNISGTLSTIVFSFIFFLLFPFLAWCSYRCFIHHSLQQKDSALLFLVTPGETWRREKEIIQITDTFSSLPSHILPCS